MKKHPLVEIRLEEILEEITRRGEISVGDVARRLGVKLSTVQQKVRPLFREGLLCFSKQGGKITVNPDYSCVVGIDLGASHLHFALANFRGEILNDFTEKIRPEDGPEKLIAQIKKGIRLQVDAVTRKRLLEKPGRVTKKKREHPFKVLGMALGVPSPVDPVSGIVSLANNLPGWKNIHLARALEKQFRVPVVIENDANMAAIGEHWRGVARGVNNFVFIALGTGIGAGVFVDGKLVRGRTGSAGELFRMNVEWQRWNEDFGDIGYFETHVSGMGLSLIHI